MAKNHVCRGKVVDYVNTGTEPILSGAVVIMGVTLGVALVDIAPAAIGAVQVEEVFTLPKKAVDALAMGDAAYWSTTEQAIVKAKTDNIYAGRVFAASPANGISVQVKLNA